LIRLSIFTFSPFLDKTMALTKLLQVSVLSTTLALSPWMTQSAMAQNAPATVGTKEAAVPPKIVKVDNQLAWSDPSAFGPVPQDKVASGNAICQSTGFARATGFHRSAQDINGKPFPSGGYFCEGKAAPVTVAATNPPAAPPVAPAAAPPAAPSAAPVASTAAPAGSQTATAAAAGGLSTAAIVGGVIVVGAAIAIAVSSSGSGSGTTGTTAPN
jgi:hypothetical protein